MTCASEPGFRVGGNGVLRSIRRVCSPRAAPTAGPGKRRGARSTSEHSKSGIRRRLITRRCSSGVRSALSRDAGASYPPMKRAPPFLVERCALATLAADPRVFCVYGAENPRNRPSCGGRVRAKRQPMAGIGAGQRVILRVLPRSGEMAIRLRRIEKVRGGQGFESHDGRWPPGD